MESPLAKRRKTNSTVILSQESNDGSVGSERVGNTRRPSPSKHWCFTVNNYNSEDIIKIIGSIGSSGLDYGCSPKYIFQEETGENGTPHLQGYVNFDRKVRANCVFKWPRAKRIHWEKCRSPKHAINYCRKEQSRTGDVYSNIAFPETLCIIDRDSLRTWQKRVVAIVEGPRDPRKIYWFYDYIGNSGKTQLTKFLCSTSDALVLSGKSADMKYGVISYIGKHNGCAPKIIIFDIPRSSKDFISYQGIEEVKNGIFFSGKYESDMCLYNPPHVICFANDLPCLEKLSMDRWAIKEIKH